MDLLRFTSRTAVCLALLAVPLRADGIFDDAHLLRFPDIHGDTVAFTYSGDIFTVDAAGGRARRLTTGEGLELFPRFSPDGKWIAFSSSDAGRSEVYVQAFPEGGGRWQVTGRGALPCWSRDGKELFYVDGSNMMAVAVTTSPSFAFGTAQRLFSLEFQTAVDVNRNWDVAPDGRFLVVLSASKQSLAGHINVVQNWFADLR